MTGRSLDWYALSREAVPGVLLGVEATTGPVQRASAAPSRQSADLMVGFEESSSSNMLATPCVALIGDDHVGELLAWLHTYSAESFPISQFCRVETAGRWELVLKRGGAPADFLGTAWASVIAGEMLANAEQNPVLKAIPLSWAAGCLSYTMARVFRVGPDRQGDWSKDATARLRTLDNDTRFARRRVGVDMLSPIWAILASGERIGSDDIHDVVAVVLSALDNEGSSRLRENVKLSSSSAEQRIHGFDEFVDDVLSFPRRDSGPKALRVGALIAGAALLAGGGTSHIDLLKPYADEFPECLPWFGLLAGLTGPRAWDPDWLRLVKGVERQIRSGFHLTDPLQCDLCWLEFDWLRQLSKSASVFVDLPKHHSRLLTVEVLPGANYQLRLVDPHQETRTTPKPTSRSDTSQARSPDARLPDAGPIAGELLMQLKAISAHLQAVIGRVAEGSSIPLRSGQGALFDTEQGKGAKRQTNRAKKNAPGN